MANTLKQRIRRKARRAKRKFNRKRTELLHGNPALLDRLAVMPVRLAARQLRWVRQKGIENMPRSRAELRRIGVYPLVDHYYDPGFQTGHLDPERKDRPLPGIEWNDAGQVALLQELEYGDEFAAWLQSDTEFSMPNYMFDSGDADMLYNVVRHFKPGKIVEIGSGNSTRVAAEAVRKNTELDPDYSCRHVCIEPYEMPWLESTGVEVVRERVETLDLSYFEMLEAGDLLFIDSSHIIRPQGDVLCEILEILPSLKPGVMVHVHDIFSPRDYLWAWMDQWVKFWNEQYLLEAFLTNNRDWEILLAVNYLTHHHYDELSRACPAITPDREPGSFYMVKRGGPAT